jgi:hypothetical protein
MNYRVDNFANYPYWFAQYPANPVGVNQLRLFSATWANVGRLFICQYAADPDRNVLVRITGVADGDPAVRTITVEEVNDLSYLEGLAGITRSAAPEALTRISPAPADTAPARWFNLLVIECGFAAAELPAIAQRLWSEPANRHSVTDTAPFGVLRNRSRLACYADDGTGVFLRIRQTASNVAGLDGALTIPPDAATLLRDYLPLLKIVADDGSETMADKVCAAWRRKTGPAGTLIAILRNGRQPARNAPPAQRPAELFQLDPSENHLVRVVAVNVTWNNELWPLVVVRGLAQNLGGLRDEIELPGDGFDDPDQGLEQAPALNVLYSTRPRATSWRLAA